MFRKKTDVEFWGRWVWRDVRPGYVSWCEEVWRKERAASPFRRSEVVMVVVVEVVVEVVSVEITSSTS